MASLARPLPVYYTRTSLSSDVLLIPDNPCKALNWCFYSETWDKRCDVYETVLRKDASSILSEDDGGVDCGLSLESHRFTIGKRDQEKAFAVSCPTAFLKSSMAATSHSGVRCTASGSISTRTLRPRLNKTAWTCQPRV